MYSISHPMAWISIMYSIHILATLNSSLVQLDNICMHVYTQSISLFKSLFENAKRYYHRHTRQYDHLDFITLAFNAAISLKKQVYI